MRNVMALLASRVLRTRYGIAFLLAAVVTGIVGIAQLVNPGEGGPAGLSPPRDSGVTVNPTAGDDGEAAAPPTPGPVISPGAVPPEQVATAFAAAWVDHVGATPATWLGRLAPLMTPDLRQRLTGVDPSGVPADRVTGAAQLTPRSETFVEVAVPVDAGTLRLRLIARDGRWLVDWLDWERVS